jgi:hypothetical protein
MEGTIANAAERTFGRERYLNCERKVGGTFVPFLIRSDVLAIDPKSPSSIQSQPFVTHELRPGVFIARDGANGFSNGWHGRKEGGPMIRRGSWKSDVCRKTGRLFHAVLAGLTFEKLT